MVDRDGQKADMVVRGSVEGGPRREACKWALSNSSGQEEGRERMKRGPGGADGGWQEGGLLG